ncbi:hypothetical protein GCM10009549_50050 [Streptomyces thermoalcalitolerans]|uniref:Uncharacterized protein n=1 Tax=Streptomyces thermoalcalitolerans TaxID=65605 RepID=A0ABN1PGC7_9ACTN
MGEDRAVATGPDSEAGQAGDAPAFTRVMARLRVPRTVGRLDDVRRTLNLPLSSAFECIDGTGARQIVTDATEPGRAHPAGNSSGTACAPRASHSGRCGASPANPSCA